MRGSKEVIGHCGPVGRQARATLRELLAEERRSRQLQLEELQDRITHIKECPSCRHKIAASIATARQRKGGTVYLEPGVEATLREVRGLSGRRR